MAGRVLPPLPVVVNQQVFRGGQALTREPKSAASVDARWCETATTNGSCHRAAIGHGGHELGSAFETRSWL